MRLNHSLKRFLYYARLCAACARKILPTVDRPAPLCASLAGDRRAEDEKCASEFEDGKLACRAIHTPARVYYRDIGRPRPTVASLLSLSARQCQLLRAYRRALFVAQMYHRVNRVTLSESAGESRLPIGSARCETQARSGGGGERGL